MKMSKIDKLRELGILNDIRQRYNANDENDFNMDNAINKLSNDELIFQWCIWKLGYGNWWTTMKYYFDELEKFDEDNFIRKEV